MMTAILDEIKNRAAVYAIDNGLDFLDVENAMLIGASIAIEITTKEIREANAQDKKDYDTVTRKENTTL